MRSYGFAIFAILIVGLGLGRVHAVWRGEHALDSAAAVLRSGKLVWMANHKRLRMICQEDRAGVNYLLDYRKKSVV
jgi:hypothetical protein